MKKLTIMLAAIAMAVVSQAATVKWSSGTIFTPGETGAFTTTKAAKSAVTYYLWTMDAATFASTTLDSIVNMDKSSATATGSNSAIGNAVSYTDSSTYGNGDTINWAMLFTYTDGDGKEWYIANMGSGTVDDLGSAVTFGNLASADSAYATVSGWTAMPTEPVIPGGDVPEPTTGLLLLVGAAGLALRRKNA